MKKNVCGEISEMHDTNFSKTKTHDILAFEWHGSIPLNQTPTFLAVQIDLMFMLLVSFPPL